MAKRGRIPKITKEAIDKFCAAIANGMSRNRAADLIGIHRMTVSRWLRQGRTGVGGPLYAHFVAEVARSEARFIEKNLESVRRAAAPRKTSITKTFTRADGSSNTEVTEKVEYDWAAARWLLECKDRESFGPDRHEIAALKKDIAALQKLLTETVGKLTGGQAEGEQAGGAVNPQTAPAQSVGGSGNPAAAPPADNPSPQPVDSGTADGTSAIG